MSAIPKPTPRLLDKRKVRADLATTDKAENAKVKIRSNGQCEVIDMAGVWPRRCPLRASHVHHLISGIGRRNRGASILAAHKLHVCERCHSEIHGRVLQPVNQTERESAATVRYTRQR